MPRPRSVRRIFFQPNVTYFKPIGIPMRSLREVILNFDELEAIRLVDYEQVDQVEAGNRMKISQPTLSRLLKTARKKIADALTNSHAIRIEGGNYKIVGSPRRYGRGRGGRLYKFNFP